MPRAPLAYRCGLELDFGTMRRFKYPAMRLALLPGLVRAHHWGSAAFELTPVGEPCMHDRTNAPFLYSSMRMQLVLLTVDRRNQRLPAGGGVLRRRRGHCPVQHARAAGLHDGVRAAWHVVCMCCLRTLIALELLPCGLCAMPMHDTPARFHPPCSMQLHPQGSGARPRGARHVPAAEDWAGQGPG